MFRRLFERGDLPICVQHASAGIRVGWTQAIEKLDLHHHLPIFMSGLRETEEPFQSLSLYGTLDLLASAGDRALPVVPQMIQPLREALTTRDQAIVRRVMEVMQKLVTSGELVGEALVPFYRQLLPVLNVFKTMHRECGGQTIPAVPRPACDDTRRRATPASPATRLARARPQTTSGTRSTTASGSAGTWASSCRRPSRPWRRTAARTPSSTSATA